MGFKSLVQKLKFKWVVRNIEQSAYSLCTNIGSAAKIVLLFPSVPESNINGEKVVNEIRQLYSQSEIFMVGGPQTNFGRLRFGDRVSKLSAGMQEITWAGLPDKAFTKKVKALEGDILIDLSVQKDYFNGILAATSDIPIRIGNYGVWGPPVYNLEIKTSYLQSEQLILKSIVEVLKNFKTGIRN